MPASENVKVAESMAALNSFTYLLYSLSSSFCLGGATANPLTVLKCLYALAICLVLSGSLMVLKYSLPCLLFVTSALYFWQKRSHVDWSAFLVMFWFFWRAYRPRLRVVVCWTGSVTAGVDIFLFFCSSCRVWYSLSYRKCWRFSLDRHAFVVLMSFINTSTAQLPGRNTGLSMWSVSWNVHELRSRWLFSTTSHW